MRGESSKGFTRVGFIAGSLRSICLGLLILSLGLAACGAEATAIPAGVAATSGTGLAGPNVGGVFTAIAASEAASTSPGSVKATATPKSGESITPTKAGAAGGTGAAIHVCALFTKADAAVTFGGPGAEVDNTGDTIPQFGTATCTYTGTVPNSLIIVVSYSQLALADFDTGFKSYSAQVVPGLGDSAFFLANTLTALKGKVQVGVTLLKAGAGVDGTLEQSKLVVQKVLDQFAKTGAAGELTSAVPPSKAQTITEADIPVYPGAQKVNSRTAPGNLTLNTYISPDSYDKIVAWYRQAFEAKTGYQSLVVETEPGLAIGNAQKVDLADNSSAMLSVIISGPKKSDRSPGTDSNGQPIVLDPNSTLIEFTFSGKQ